jgi:hypothetical protein
MSILDHCVQIAFSHAALVAGVRVAYVRGELSRDVEAIAGTQTVLQTSDYDNLIHKRHRESFIVTPSDLVDFGEPQAGDQVRYTPPGRPDIVLVFTLRSDDNGPPFRPTDRYHTRWRVNTTLTGKEAA